MMSIALRVAGLEKTAVVFVAEIRRAQFAP